MDYLRTVDGPKGRVKIAEKVAESGEFLYPNAFRNELPQENYPEVLNSLHPINVADTTLKI